MILFPAIDLKEGACVRLVRGEMASATVFNRDPAAQAKQFANAGFRWLHVVAGIRDAGFKTLQGTAVQVGLEIFPYGITAPDGVRINVNFDQAVQR